MRSRSVAVGAVTLLALAGCARQKPDDEPVPPVQLVQQPAASAGGACILWNYPFIKQKIGVTFEVAASDQVDDTSTCVVQTIAGDWPDLALSVVESTTAGAATFAALMPAKAVKLKGVGQAAYLLDLPASGGHGPVVEIGWLSEAKQLQTLRFTFAKGATAAEVKAMHTKLFNLAKAMDTTAG